MEVGVAQVEITPEVGGELCGFAARVQPSTGVLDPLYAKALYLVDGEERLLWITCDLLGVPRSVVEDFRRWALEELDLEPREVMVCATHTHSGPATMVLHEAGQLDPKYLDVLQEKLQEVAFAALEQTERCEMVAVEGTCDLAVDRRKKASAHADPRVAAFGWWREDGTFAAVLLNYPMHAVALGPMNRQISADWPGRCAATLSNEIPGNPLVLVTNGACGNLNPPFENVSEEQLNEWGATVASSVKALLLEAAGEPECNLATVSSIESLPLDVLSVEGISAYAEASLRNVAGIHEWGDKFRRAIENWRRFMIDGMESGTVPLSADMELHAIRLAGRILLGVNVEVFSTFTDLARAGIRMPVYTIGYANGLTGYLPTAEAFDEGGYEVEMAHLFYNSFRMQRGNLERLAQSARGLVGDME